jgi:aspartyl-tRNA(Asn)/glutamyl-tRNA(Gln) amidotransferase subunit B
MYTSFIGLEIHIRLLTNTKVFCSCKTSFGEEPNTNVCPVCMGYPGVLPALNRESMKMAYLVARTLNCTLAEQTHFERKNYFYPDMPKNYQISQYATPVGTNGYIDVETGGDKKRVRIHDVHLEEDAGKMVHSGAATYCDYNRAGTSLLEIVTEPDLVTGEDAEEFIQEFRRVVRYLGVCDGNMEEGSLKCDANVSVNEKGHGLGKKVELKNLNSSRFVKKGLNYEIERQVEVLEEGGELFQETRLWDEKSGTTTVMRTKESAHDYRYFPEPDLPPFRADGQFVKEVERDLVELPLEKRQRFASHYELPDNQVRFLCEEKPMADFFERTVSFGADPEQAAVWLSGDIQKILNREGRGLAESPFSPKRITGLITMVKEGKISGRIAKDVVERIYSEDKDPELIVEEQGWEQIDDTSAVEAMVDQVIAEQQKAVTQIQEGDQKPIGFLVGQVMKLSSGKADPKLVQKLLREKLL